MTRSAKMTMTSPGLAFLAQFTRQLVALVKAFKDRREVMNLAEFDDRMLSDIGLTRSDVSSALAEPLHLNPSWVLVRCVDQRARTDRTTDHARKVRLAVPLVKRAA
ncbi:DUF1127 domain-containing protein [Microvirga sp. P5_D2]